MGKAALIISILFVVGCGLFEDEDTLYIKLREFERMEEPFNLTTELRPRYDGMEMRLYLEIKTDTAVVIGTGGNRCDYSFAVVDTDSMLIWADYYRGSCQLALHIKTFEPGKYLVHEGKWDYGSNYGRSIRNNQDLLIIGRTDIILYPERTSFNEPDYYISEPIPIKY